jgi:hypothetical protein
VAGPRIGRQVTTFFLPQSGLAWSQC